MGFDFALKTYCTLKLFLLSAQNNFHFSLSSYVEGYVKKEFKSAFCVFGWLPGLQNLDIFWNLYYESIFEIIFRQK